MILMQQQSSILWWIPAAFPTPQVVPSRHHVTKATSEAFSNIWKNKAKPSPWVQQSSGIKILGKLNLPKMTGCWLIALRLLADLSRNGWWEWKPWLIRRCPLCWEFLNRHRRHPTGWFFFSLCAILVGCWGQHREWTEKILWHRRLEPALWKAHTELWAKFPMCDGSIACRWLSMV